MFKAVSKMRWIDRENFVIFLAFILTLGFVGGYLCGMDRAVKSAELVSYSSSGYEIRYDLVGTHTYN